MCFAQSAPPRTISISSTSQIVAQPDMARLSVGVEAVGKNPQIVMQDIKTKGNAIITALKVLGVEERDIVTSSLQLTPQYLDKPSDKKRPIIDSYRANNSLTITIHDFTKTGLIVDDVITKGGNQLNDLSFDLKDRIKFMDEARIKAAQDSRRKAELYANAIGVKLGGLASLTESEARPAFQPMMRAAAAAGDSAPLMVQPGEITVSVELQTVWNIE